MPFEFSQSDAGGLTQDREHCVGNTEYDQELTEMKPKDDCQKISNQSFEKETKTKQCIENSMSSDEFDLELSGEKISGGERRDADVKNNTVGTICITDGRVHAEEVVIARSCAKDSYLPEHEKVANIFQRCVKKAKRSAPGTSQKKIKVKESKKRVSPKSILKVKVGKPPADVDIFRRKEVVKDQESNALFKIKVDKGNTNKDQKRKTKRTVRKRTKRQLDELVSISNNLTEL